MNPYTSSAANDETCRALGARMKRPTTSHGGVVDVGPFAVVDCPAGALADDLAQTVVQRLVYALHIGGLNAAHDQVFVEAMRRADLIYADSASVSILARHCGAVCIERAPTTDLGWDVIRRMSREQSRNVRVVLIGGTDATVRLASRALEDHGPVEVVGCINGYADNYTDFLRQVRAARPDILFVGMGMPLEARWVDAQRDLLPECLVMTCGGWFGFLAGEEPRCPSWMSRVGLEWLYRLRLNPRRLAPRYMRGLYTFATIYLGRSKT